MSELIPEPVLGAIEESEEIARSPLDFDSSGIAVEQFRRLRINLGFIDVDKPIRSLVITSASEGEGKTTVAVNLALALASAQKRVLLVDGDLRRPAIARFLGLSSAIGLTGFLRGDEVEDQIQTSAHIGVDVMASGPEAPNPAELLGSDRLKLFITNVGRTYDFVVVDAPPIGPVADALVLGEVVDGVLLVSRVGVGTKAGLRAASAELASSPSNVCGVLVNGVGRSTIGYGYYGSSELDRDVRARGSSV
ncbi:CpsD/CapB family tyrosine-protein kinase [Gordonia sp. i37]|uniref:CpsD/CapB family tyrosine-protein kinase n=1 Tax=Gordonia sp. i37 TaxID=1961707 RepID=UPI00209BA8FC|nr:CpsD/CapB family tyrosine-protein kinase [Gordonia sp. i37]